MDLVFLPFTAISTGTELTEPITVGWGRVLFNDSCGSLFKSHYSKQPRWLQNCYQDHDSTSFYCKTDSSHSPTSLSPLQSMLDVLLILVWLSLCLRHMLHFWLCAYPVGSRGSFYLHLWVPPPGNKSRTQRNQIHSLYQRGEVFSASICHPQFKKGKCHNVSMWKCEGTNPDHLWRRGL